MYKCIECEEEIEYFDVRETGEREGTYQDEIYDMNGFAGEETALICPACGEEYSETEVNEMYIDEDNPEEEKPKEELTKEQYNNTCINSRNIYEKNIQTNQFIRDYS